MNVDFYYDQIKDAKLEVLDLGNHVNSFALRKYPDSKEVNSLILFTPVGIVITGELSPHGRAVVAPGYGLEWFSSELDPDALALSFLDLEWVWSKAFAYFKSLVDQFEEERQTLEDEDCPPSGRFLPRKWRVKGREIVGTEGDALKALLTVKEFLKTPETLFDALPVYEDSQTGLWVCP